MGLVDGAAAGLGRPRDEGLDRVPAALQGVRRLVVAGVRVLDELLDARAGPRRRHPQELLRDHPVVGKIRVERVDARGLAGVERGTAERQVHVLELDGAVRAAAGVQRRADRARAGRAQRVAAQVQVGEGPVVAQGFAQDHARLRAEARVRQQEPLEPPVAVDRAAHGHAAPLAERRVRDVEVLQAPVPRQAEPDRHARRRTERAPAEVELQQRRVLDQRHADGRPPPVVLIRVVPALGDALVVALPLVQGRVTLRYTISPERQLHELVVAAAHGPHEGAAALRVQGAVVQPEPLQLALVEVLGERPRGLHRDAVPGQVELLQLRRLVDRLQHGVEAFFSQAVVGEFQGRELQRRHQVVAKGLDQVVAQAPLGEVDVVGVAVVAHEDGLRQAARPRVARPGEGVPRRVPGLVRGRAAPDGRGVVRGEPCHEVRVARGRGVQDGDAAPHAVDHAVVPNFRLAAGVVLALAAVGVALRGRVVGCLAHRGRRGRRVGRVEARDGRPEVRVPEELLAPPQHVPRVVVRMQLVDARRAVALERRLAPAKLRVGPQQILGELEVAGRRRPRRHGCGRARDVGRLGLARERPRARDPPPQRRVGSARPPRRPLDRVARRRELGVDFRAARDEPSLRIGPRRRQGRARGGPRGARGPRPRGGPRSRCRCPRRRLWPRRARGAGPRRRLRALPYHVEPGGLAPARADRAHRRRIAVDHGVVLAPELADGAPVRGRPRPFRRERDHARRPRRRRRGQRQREALGPLGAVLLDRSHAQVAQRGCLGQGHPALERDIRHQYARCLGLHFCLQYASCGSFGLQFTQRRGGCQRERCVLANAERFCRSRERASTPHGVWNGVLW